jgi:hypothetical protein
MAAIAGTLNGAQLLAQLGKRGCRIRHGCDS